MTRWVCGSLFVVAVAAQSAVGRERTETQSVALDDAKSVQVRVEFGAGRFDLAKTSSGQLMEGSFETESDDLEVLVNYRRRGERGVLDLTTEHFEHTFSGSFKNDWSVGLAEGVPLELDLDLGAVDAELDLSGLSISDLQLDVGAADCLILWDQPNPEEIRDLDIQTGASSLRVEGLGHAHFSRLRFDGGLGEFELDFSGEWAQSAEASFEVGLGELTLLVPANIGVRIETDKALASVKVDRHFDQDGDVYESENYHTAEIKLDCTVELGMGSLVVKTLGQTP